MNREPGLIVSCEHGGHQIPVEFQHLFAAAGEVLESHRGYDIGALALARKITQKITASLLVSEVSRLLVDLNRIPQQQTLFSEFTQHLSMSEQQQIIDLYYRPYQNQIRRQISTYP